MDDAIETLQTCLRLLDLVHRVGEMIREGKYWGALRVSDSHWGLSDEDKLSKLVIRGSTPPATAVDI